ncbi:hypothetical protein [Actinokineospora diospyrosa]|uniref:Excreted virulence factor EspC (Type VII ESX diderm) n=1 Tax=Actinokineospora diospyrosa TaxID=103728 RepID=A0ABT1I8J7_9PSEU|nr:hypothetical protein [Actinokineospora diospyrosa]MCP2268960.1 hypothetical protein [Actinokineospora diospyrosa]
MDEHELVGLISGELDGGFAVDAAALGRYGRGADARAEGVRRIGRGLAVVDGTGFGWIGRESGFADALRECAGRVRERVEDGADAVERLGIAVARTGAAHRRDDHRAAAELGRLA